MKRMLLTHKMLKGIQKNKTLTKIPCPAEESNRGREGY